MHLFCAADEQRPWSHICTNKYPASSATDLRVQPNGEASSLTSLLDRPSASGPVIDGPASPPNGLPDDPVKQNPDPTRKPQTKRILGIIPNFRAVSTDEKLSPQTPKEKFLTTTLDSFDYSAAVIPIVLAGYSLGIDATPEFEQGMGGYGQYLWRAAVDQTTVKGGIKGNQCSGAKGSH